jgi:cell division protease FtsH
VLFRSGAANDIERATQIARRMVCEWGMSEKMGPVSFGRREDQPFLGRELGHQRDFSEQTALNIEKEVRRIVDDNYQRSRNLLTTHYQLLERIANMLLERETLDLKDVDKIIAEIEPELLSKIPEIKQMGKAMPHNCLAGSAPESKAAEDDTTEETDTPPELKPATT